MLSSHHLSRFVGSLHPIHWHLDCRVHQDLEVLESLMSCEQVQTFPLGPLWRPVTLEFLSIPLDLAKIFSIEQAEVGCLAFTHYGLGPFILLEHKSRQICFEEVGLWPTVPSDKRTWIECQSDLIYLGFPTTTRAG